MRVHVGRPKRVHEALGVVFARGARILDDGERFGPVRRNDLLDFLADLGEGVVPAYRLKLARFGAAHRTREPFVGIRHLRKAVAASADVPLRVGMHVAAAKRPEPASHRRGNEPAFARAAVA